MPINAVSSISVPQDLATQQRAKDEAALTALGGQRDALNSMYNTLTGKMGESALQLMTGAIPDDVQAQVRQLASENAGLRGLGLGQARQK